LVGDRWSRGPGHSSPHYAGAPGQYKQIIATETGKQQHETIMTNQSLPYDVFFEALRENEVDALKAYPVLIVCGDAQCSDRMVAAVRKRGLEAICCSSVEDARSLLSRRRFSLVLSSDILPDGEVHAVIRLAGAMPVIVFSQRAEWDVYLDALDKGAFEYIACPPDAAETERILELALQETAHS
jgi:hypothetical protein